MRLLPTSTRTGHIAIGVALIIVFGLFIAVCLVLALASRVVTEVEVKERPAQVKFEPAKSPPSPKLPPGVAKVPPPPVTKAPELEQPKPVAKGPEEVEVKPRAEPAVTKDGARRDAIAEPAVNGEPVSDANGAWRFRVQGEFRPSVDSVRRERLRTAQEHIREWLASQESPIQQAPKLETIRTRMNFHEIARQEEQILNQKDRMYKMTVEVELQPKLMRELRERDRVGLGVWAFGGVVGMLGLVVLLFRFDEWTKGYLTRFLMVGGGVVGVAAVVMWFWSFEGK